MASKRIFMTQRDKYRIIIKEKYTIFLYKMSKTKNIRLIFIIKQKIKVKRAYLGKIELRDGLHSKIEG
jgi:hypothetical protein